MYYMAFTFNVANLDPRYIIHFDLYNTRIKNSDIDVTQFAPFSHDAESGPRERVPEPQTIVLMSAGLLALFAAKRIR